MKRYIATFVAALMLVASMATTALAVEYNLSLSVVDTEGNAVTEVKKGDVVIVNANLSAITGTSGLKFNIGVDPEVFALKNDPATEADEQFIAAWDDANNCASAPCVPYSFYQNWDSLAQKWGTMAHEVPASLINDLKTVGFGYMNGSNLRTNLTDVLVGAVQLEVIADPATDTATTISVVNPEIANIAGALSFTSVNNANVTVKSSVVTPTNVTVSASGANAVVKVTAAGADVNNTAIAAGTEVTLSVKPMVGYEISAVNGISAPLTGMGGTYTFTADADTTITVTAAEVTAAPVTVAAAYVDAATKTNVVFGKASDVSGEYGIYLKKGSEDYVINNANATFNGYGPYFAAKNNNNGYFAINFHGLEAATYTAAAYDSTGVAAGYNFVVE